MNEHSDCGYFQIDYVYTNLFAENSHIENLIKCISIYYLYLNLFENYKNCVQIMHNTSYSEFIISD